MARPPEKKPRSLVRLGEKGRDDCTGLVVEDYYEQGKNYNKTLERRAAETKLGPIEYARRGPQDAATVIAMAGTSSGSPA